MTKQQREICYWKKEAHENKVKIDDLNKLVKTLKEDVRNFTTNDVSNIFNDNDWDMMMNIDDIPTLVLQLPLLQVILLNTQRTKTTVNTSARKL